MVSEGVEEGQNGLDQIWESRALYADILFSFRECHDLCVQSKLFTKEIILQIDQCAVDFRQLSLDTVSIAKRVSNQWLDSTLTFYENIDDVDDPKEMLILLGNQARDLGYCFKIIAAWARDLSGRFHEAQDGTIKEAEEFKAAFKAASERAKKFQEELDVAHDKAEKRRENAKSVEEKWNTARLAVSWIPIGLVVTSIGCSVAQSKVAEASKLEEEAAERLRKAKEELDKKTSQREKAEVHFF